MDAVGVTLDQVRQDVPEADGGGPTAGELGFTHRAGQVLTEGVHREAPRFGHDYIGTGHVLLALIDGNEGVAARMLESKVRNGVGYLIAAVVAHFPELPSHQLVALLSGAVDPAALSQRVVMPLVEVWSEALMVHLVWTANVYRLGKPQGELTDDLGRQYGLAGLSGSTWPATGSRSQPLSKDRCIRMSNSSR